MNAINPSDLSFSINLESENYAPEDSEWQEECHKFYLQLRNTLDGGIVRPLKIEKKEKGCRGDIHTLCDVIHVAVAFIDLYLVCHAIKEWYAHKKGSKVTLKFSDGNYIECSNYECPEQCLIKKNIESNSSSLFI